VFRAGGPDEVLEKDLDRDGDPLEIGEALLGQRLQTEVGDVTGARR
jgi:hypothetical protein